MRRYLIYYRATLAGTVEYWHGSRASQYWRYHPPTPQDKRWVDFQMRYLAETLSNHPSIVDKIRAVEAS